MAHDKRQKEYQEHVKSTKFHQDMITHPQGVLKVGDRSLDLPRKGSFQPQPEDPNYPWGKKQQTRVRSVDQYKGKVVNPVTHVPSTIDYSRRPRTKKSDDVTPKPNSSLPSTSYTSKFFQHKK
jgi:hypothetical protein